MISKVFNNMSGKILIASPRVLFSGVFRRSVIYILTHSESGSIGVIINRPMQPLSDLPSFLKQKHAEPVNLPIEALNIAIHLGGPVEHERGFFLHSAEYNKNVLLHLDNNLALSSNQEIVNDIANKQGPKELMFLAGYTVWARKQMEDEIRNNLWVAAECDHDFIFKLPDEEKWQFGLRAAGVNERRFSAGVGHC